VTSGYKNESKSDATGIPEALPVIVNRRKDLSHPLDGPRRLA
jgi:hypothetical protein